MTYFSVKSEFASVLKNNKGCESLTINRIVQKRFYTREKIRGIRISRLAKISTFIMIDRDL